MDEDIVSGGIDREWQTTPIGNSAAMDQHIMLLSLCFRFGDECLALIDLQVIESAYDGQTAQTK